MDCAKVVAVMRSLSGVEFEDARPDGSRPSNLDDLHRRHQEYGVEPCIAVARYKATLWLPELGAETDSMVAYYRPSTLFRPCHFGEYLAAARSSVRRPGRCREHGSSDCAWCCRAHGLPVCAACASRSR